MFTQKDKESVLIFNIPIRTILEFKRIAGINPAALPVAKLIIEWTINQFINGKSSSFDCQFIQKLHDDFINANYQLLSNLPKDTYVKESQWEESVLSITFSTEKIKRLPVFWRVKKTHLVIDINSKYEDQGILYAHALAMDFGFAEPCRKPYHQLQQDQYLLSEGIHSFKKLQEKYDQSPEVFNGVFFEVRNDNNSLDFFLDDIRATITGKYTDLHPVKVNEKIIPTPSHFDEDGLPWNDGSVTKESKKPITHFQPTKVNGKVDWKKQSHRMIADGKEYRSPHKCANDKRVSVGQVYSRIYSKESRWNGWYFMKNTKI